MDEYNEDQLEDDGLEAQQYEQRIMTTNINTKGLKGDNSSVYYISAPTSNSSMNNDSQLQSPQRQTKIITQSQASSNNDPDERFLLSCLPILKRLPNKKNALARLKIQQLLFEIEFDEYSEMSGQ